MIEPFEYEKTVSQVNMREGAVKNDLLDVSTLDKPLHKLNNFKRKAEHASFLEVQKPFTESFQKEVGRVKEGNKNKAFFQDESIATRGSMVSGYDTREMKGVVDRENASVLISRYLDSEVGYVPPVMETVDSIANLRASEPVLVPGISFIDSRKNMATQFQ